MIPPSESLITALFSAGRADEVLFQGSCALALNPESGFFWKAFGSASLQCGRPNIAAKLLGRALAIDGTDQYTWMTRAVALFQLGKHADSLRHHLTGLLIGPDNASAYQNCGVANAGLGNAASACGYHRRAVCISPIDASAWTNLGASATGAGNTDEGLSACEHAICIDPGLPRCLGMLGVILQQKGSIKEALRFHSRAVLGGAYETSTLGNFGGCLIELQEFKESERFLAQAVTLQPENTKWLSSLAIAFRGQKEFHAALQYNTWAISVDPFGATAIDCKGTTLRQSRRHEDALVLYKQALVLEPDFVEALTNTGNACFEMRESKAALKLLEWAFVAAPHNFAVPWNASLIYLATGDFSRGWELYEYRFAAGAVRAMALKELPSFDLDTSTNSCVLITPEQGIGDELMFCTMIPEFREVVGRVIVQSDPRLVPLLRRSFTADIQIVATGPITDFTGIDMQISAGSLARYVWHCSDDHADRRKGFLRADTRRVMDFRRLLDSHVGGPRLGISWKCSNKESSDIRNVQLALLCQTVREIYPDVLFVCLQYGSVDADIDEANRKGITNILQIPGLDITTDLDGVAALIGACDAVMTIGNTTAHLAGALGKVAAVLLPFSPSWRWMLEGERSAWYRSLRLHRKTNHKAEWGAVIRAAAKDLKIHLEREHPDVNMVKKR